VFRIIPENYDATVHSMTLTLQGNFTIPDIEMGFIMCKVYVAGFELLIPSKYVTNLGVKMANVKITWNVPIQTDIKSFVRNNPTDIVIIPQRKSILDSASCTVDIYGVIRFYH